MCELEGAGSQSKTQHTLYWCQGCSAHASAVRLKNQDFSHGLFRIIHTVLTPENPELYMIDLMFNSIQNALKSLGLYSKFHYSYNQEMQTQYIYCLLSSTFFVKSSAVIELMHLADKEMYIIKDEIRTVVRDQICYSKQLAETRWKYIPLYRQMKHLQSKECNMRNCN